MSRAHSHNPPMAQNIQGALPPPRTFMRALGPGLLFAGAAVGVSHFVQSTRAGADFGFGLLAVIVLANLLKYPAFAFGPHYAAATGTSLLEGYRRQGRWALWVYLALTLCTCFTVQAVVTVVTAGIACAVLGFSYEPPKVAGLNLSAPVAMSALLMLASAVMLAAGRFKWLDRANKLLVAGLTVSTLAATLLVLPQIEWSQPGWLPPKDALTDRAHLVRITALVGWMPSAFDVSIWHSLWTLARRDDTGHRPSVRQALLDFNVGYYGTALLALCFMAMGAGVMFHSGAKFEDNAARFGAQVVNLYAASLGEWSRPLLGLCALSVMFSTTLTVVDGFPRALATLVKRFGEAEREDGLATLQPRVYRGAMAVMALGSLGILAAVPAGQFKFLVDLATTLSFLSAPFFAVLNHRAVFAPWVAPELRPGERMRWLSLAGIFFLSGFALYFLYITFA